MFNKNIVLSVRIVLGFVLFVFGLNKFLGFMGMMELEGAAGDFFNALIGSGYMFPVIGLVEVLAGLALLNNRFVPLALVLQAPVTINFILFHLFLDLSSNIGPGVLVLLTQLYLMFAYIQAYKPFLQAKNEPIPQKIIKNSTAFEPQLQA